MACTDGSTQLHPAPQVYRAEWRTWVDAEQTRTRVHRRRGLSAEQVKALRSHTPGVIFDVDRGEMCRAMRHEGRETACICATADAYNA